MTPLPAPTLLSPPQDVYNMNTWRESICSEPKRIKPIYVSLWPSEANKQTTTTKSKTKQIKHNKKQSAKLSRLLKKKKIRKKKKKLKDLPSADETLAKYTIDNRTNCVEAIAIKRSCVSKATNCPKSQDCHRLG